MAVKYVKDFDFPSSAGFHSGAKGYAKGGAVKAPTRTKSTMKREMTQSNKLSGNGALPRISDMDVNKQSGGAGKKLMPGYKAGGPIKAKKGVYITKADEKVIARREAEYAATNARIAAEEAKPLNRFKKFAEDTSADVLEGYKSKIKRPVLRAVAKAGPKIEKALYKIPNKRAKVLGLGAGALGTAAAASLMGDDDEADMEMEDIPVTAIRRTESIPDMEMDDIPVTAIRRTESLSAPVKKAASKPVSAMDAVLAYNKLHNKDFDKSTEQEIRNRFASPSEGGMKSGGKVSKYADGGMRPMPSVEDRMKSIMKAKMEAKRGDFMEKRKRSFAEMTNPSLAEMANAGGGDATYGASMTSQERSKMKRGIDPYEDRTRGLPSGSMSDLDAELISKELRQKYGKKEDRPVMHPGGRQRFLLNQTEKAPMKRGGKAEASKSDMQQDRALMARHNRLMHPDQKSKMKNGGKSVPSYSSKPLIKKSGGGNYNY